MEGGGVVKRPRRGIATSLSCGIAAGFVTAHYYGVWGVVALIGFLAVIALHLTWVAHRCR